MGSPSLRGRGLKYTGDKVGGLNSLVALFARAWIEIFATSLYCPLYLVALFARAWIEME